MRSVRQGRGFTMIEWLVTAAVTLIVLLGVVTGLRSFQARKQVEGLAHNLVADLNLARSAALGASQSVRLSTSGDGRSWQLVRCATAAACSTGGDAFKVTTVPPNVALSPNRSFTFSAPRALAAPASQSVCLTAGASVTPLKVAIESTVGTPSLCAVGGASSGLPACSSAC